MAGLLYGLSVQQALTPALIPAVPLGTPERSPAIQWRHGSRKPVLHRRPGAMVSPAAPPMVPIVVPETIPSIAIGGLALWSELAKAGTGSQSQALLTLVTVPEA